jgi:OHCU decarboxylase
LNARVIPDGAEKGAFLARYGALYEHSPWVAEGAWEQGPFADVDELHAALERTMRDAPAERQLALIRAHPDLAGKAKLTRESAGEQASAGLDRLSPEEFATFTDLNAAYRDRFGFPFVICVRDHDKASILAAMRERVAHGREQEVETAIGEIARIARLRLEDAVAC